MNKAKPVLAIVVFVLCMTMGSAFAQQSRGYRPVEIDEYPQEFAESYTQGDGLPSNNTYAVTVSSSGQVQIGTDSGLATRSNGKWDVLPESQGYAVNLLAEWDGSSIATAAGALYRVNNGEVSELASLPAGNPNDLVASGDTIYVGTTEGLYTVESERTEPVPELNDQLGDDKAVNQIAAGPNERLAVATAAGLFERQGEGKWLLLQARDGDRSWALVDVRGTAYDVQGRLWFASPQGVGMRDPGGWTLYTGDEGLPYNDFTKIAASSDGSMWFGTRIGAIHFDSGNWEYRQGLRWLPGDDVRDLAVDSDGHAYFATNGGVGFIGTKPMTLMQKARIFEDAIDKYHRRTPYGYVLQVHLPAPGDTSSWENMDSDNDGLWTCMYGAGECFAYAATKTQYFKERATNAFEAMRFLMDVTQGGKPPAQEGFVARTILPTSGPNPNEGAYTPERDRQRQERDKLWKVLDPRWGTSADGQWYWKTDTSSDELDGHYFFQALYYDLVCETEPEKQAVRDFIRKLTDHLVRNNFQLVDHDGEPTRWAVYNPERFNSDPSWAIERGLNSLSILSYLATAYHITGDPTYQKAIEDLVENHAYAINMMVPKVHVGPGSGNQSDDEMAFMSFYNLMKYAPEGSKLREVTAYAWSGYWVMEKPELNPLFNFMYASQCSDKTFATAFNAVDLTPHGRWLEQSIDQLERFPLNRINWRLQNRHRLDVVPFPNYMRDSGEFRDAPFRKGHRVDGNVLPIDERFVGHWNHDPWQLDQGGNGQELADGASYLLPYYLGLYYGFIQ